MSDSKELTKSENKPVKKTGRGGKYNFPSTVPPEDPEIVRQTLTNCLHWYKMDKCKTDDDVEQRTLYFFEYCIEHGERPTVEKYCMSLGYARQTVNEWERGINASSRRTDIIKKAKEFLASYDADLVTTGQLAAIPWIFRAKNYYGMSDQTQLTIETKQNIIDISADEIAEKYKELPE